MSWSDLTRNQKLVTVFTILTALMHFAFSPNWFGAKILGMDMGILFIINGVGYGALLFLTYFYGGMKDKQPLFRLLLGGFTLGSILIWLIFHAEVSGGSLLDQSVLNKVIEVLLLVFLVQDIREKNDA